ncbi:cerebral dopamine neurotrophic factor [Hypomesus transpacificus]|uniref:cerebral dopamine neurotrophic factor n=1 Tax=Hypomesus transpacificus TaxID=137520 RepID=UPI001F07F352|nr:cerebral dopamine neurotrophic factor [Hypomesus transpacificus]
MFLSSFIVLHCLGAVSVSAAGDCEVCVGFLQRIYKTLTSAHGELSPALVEEELLRTCAVAQGKEGRLCYYLGATSDAATRVTGSVSRPLSSHVPVEKICQRLSNTDTQICQLRYEQQLWDLSSAGLSRVRVAELRRVLASWGEECRGCLEKHEYIRLIQERAPFHIHTTEL